jgi:hypothetical protein
LPSPMAVKISSSMAAFSASVRWYELMVSKNSCGEGCGLEAEDNLLPHAGISNHGVTEGGEGANSALPESMFPKWGCRPWFFRCSYLRHLSARGNLPHRGRFRRSARVLESKLSGCGPARARRTAQVCRFHAGPVRLLPVGAQLPEARSIGNQTDSRHSTPRRRAFPS